MSDKSSSKFSTPKEKIAAIVLLAALIVIFISILISQSQYDLSKYGLSYSKAEASSQLSASKRVNVRKIIPQGYTLSGKTFTFNNQTLYEKINGKAPMYLKAGYRKLITQRFINRYNKKFWFEVYMYDMGSVKNAFSVFSRQKRSGAKNRRNILYCYYTQNAEIFIRDNYYIEIIGSENNAGLLRSIYVAANKIRIQLGTIKPIYELQLLKNRYLVQGSEKYYLKNAFGFQGFSKVFTARYKYKASKTTVFVAGPFSKANLSKTIKSYRRFLIKEGGKKESNKSAIPNLVVLNYDRSIETIFKVQQYAAGVHEADDKNSGIKLSEILHKTILRNLKAK